MLPNLYRLFHYYYKYIRPLISCLSSHCCKHKQIVEVIDEIDMNNSRTLRSLLPNSVLIFSLASWLYLTSPSVFSWRSGFNHVHYSEEHREAQFRSQETTYCPEWSFQFDGPVYLPWPTGPVRFHFVVLPHSSWSPCHSVCKINIYSLSTVQNEKENDLLLHICNQKKKFGIKYKGFLVIRFSVTSYWDISPLYLILNC